MKIGLVGYGTGGQHFHAPFIAVAEGVELVGVVARTRDDREGRGGSAGVRPSTRASQR